MRESFIERGFASYCWTQMLEQEPPSGDLVNFHTAHKLTLMAHSPIRPRSGHHPEMGRLVADVGKRDWDELTVEYRTQLM